MVLVDCKVRLCSVIIVAGVILSSCHPQNETHEKTAVVESLAVIRPALVSDTVLNDSDDPAIWIDTRNPAKSLIIGTDKGGDVSEGGMHVFDLNGKEIVEKRVTNLKRPNNVDVAYGMILSGKTLDIAVCTERNTNSIRVFSLPDMKLIDNGGITVFEGDSLKAPMGVALYRAPEGKIYAIVGRKKGPDGSYLWQYELNDSGKGFVMGRVVRKFGLYSGKNEVESIAVDAEMGYVYYSDEGVGVRKYYVHPDSSNTQLALFATKGFSEDHEGISIYKVDDKRGFILVSDQGADQFHIFLREGTAGSPHDHKLVRIVKVSTHQSDGSDVVSFPLPGFPKGLFVAMSDDKTFQFYQWSDIIGELDNAKSAMKN